MVRWGGGRSSIKMRSIFVIILCLLVHINQNSVLPESHVFAKSTFAYFR